MSTKVKIRVEVRSEHVEGYLAFRSARARAVNSMESLVGHALVGSDVVLALALASLLFVAWRWSEAFGPTFMLVMVILACRLSAYALYMWLSNALEATQNPPRQPERAEAPTPDEAGDMLGLGFKKVVFSEHGVKESGREYACFFSWNAVEEVVEGDEDCLYVFVRGGMCVIVPTAELEDEQRSEIEHIVRQHHRDDFVLVDNPIT